MNRREEQLGCGRRCKFGKRNLSVHEHEGGTVEGVAEGLRWASVICLSVNIIVFVHGWTITGGTQ